jgi:inner membrane protein
MLFFGHIGLTIGITRVCQDLITYQRRGQNNSPDNYQPEANIVKKRNSLVGIQQKMRFIDYRFILLGSLLPDIIDKPVWLFTSSSVRWDGRGYSHTFLFSFVLLIIGLVLAARWKKAQLLTISVGSFFHLIFDQMWLNPTALWWPLLGPIPREQIPNYLALLWEQFLSNPYTYVSESLGLIILVYISIRIITKKRVVYFLKTGHIDIVPKDS